MRKYAIPLSLIIALVAVGVSAFSVIYVNAAVNRTTLTSEDPTPSSNFLVEIDGLVSAGPWWFLEGIQMGADVITVRDASGLPEVKIPGEVHYAPEGIVIRGPFSENRDDMRQWAEDILDGVDDRRNASIVILDRERNEVLRFQLTRAWVSEYRVSPLGPAHAQGCVNCAEQILQEEFTLQAEGIAIESSS